jgi:hypothetical protein
MQRLYGTEINGLVYSFRIGTSVSTLGEELNFSHAKNARGRGPPPELHGDKVLANGALKAQQSG